MIRLFDVVLSAAGLVIGLPLFAMLWGLVWLENRSPIFRQVCLGRHLQPFVLVNFRTMRRDTGNVPTHMVSALAVTPLGISCVGQNSTSCPNCGTCFVAI